MWPCKKPSPAPSLFVGWEVLQVWGEGRGIFLFLTPASSRQQSLANGSSRHHPPSLPFHLGGSKDVAPSLLVWILDSVIPQPKSSAVWWYLFAKSSCSTWVLTAGTGKVWVLLLMFPFCPAHGDQGEAPIKGHTLGWFMESCLHPDEMRSVIVGLHIIFMLSSVSLWVNML